MDISGRGIVDTKSFFKAVRLAAFVFLDLFFKILYIDRVGKKCYTDGKKDTNEVID